MGYRNSGPDSNRDCGPTLRPERFRFGDGGRVLSAGVTALIMTGWTKIYARRVERESQQLRWRICSYIDGSGLDSFSFRADLHRPRLDDGPTTPRADFYGLI